MRAELKSLDLDPDPAALPSDPAGFSMLARMMVGPADGLGEESFRRHRLHARMARRGVPQGRRHLRRAPSPGGGPCRLRQASTSRVARCQSRRRSSRHLVRGWGTPWPPGLLGVRGLPALAAAIPPCTLIGARVRTLCGNSGRVSAMCSAGLARFFGLDVKVSGKGIGEPRCLVSGQPCAHQQAAVVEVRDEIVANGLDVYVDRPRRVSNEQVPVIGTR
jgi:hypothetical protein